MRYLDSEAERRMVAARNKGEMGSLMGTEFWFCKMNKN